MGTVDLGTLSGTVELEDQMSGTLEMLARKVEEFAKGFDGMMGLIAKSALGVVGAIAAIGGAIVGLGSRGSDINDVADTLEHFAGSAENARAIMDKLRKGTMDQVDDFDLMRTSAGLLSKGVKLTADEFGTLGQAAFVLQNRGLGGTKEMLDLVSGALATGRTRSLAMALGVVDNANALSDFAKKLGKTEQDLTASERATATRITVMKMLSGAVRDAGEAHKDFGEVIASIGIKMKNWFDELAAGVAKSPAVMKMVNAIGDAIQRNFGGAGQTVMETVLKWIDSFANAAAEYGPKIIDWIGSLVQYVKDLYEWIRKAWDSTPGWLKDIAKEAAITGGAIALVSKVTEGATGESALSSIASLATIWSGFGNAMIKTKGYIVELTQSMKAFGVVETVFAYSLAGWGTLTAIVGSFAAGIYEVQRAIDSLYKTFSTAKANLAGFLNAMLDAGQAADPTGMIRVFRAIGVAADEAAGKAQKALDMRKQMPGSEFGMVSSHGGPTTAPLPPPDITRYTASVQALIDKITGVTARQGLSDLAKALEAPGVAASMTAPLIEEYGKKIDSLFKESEQFFKDNPKEWEKLAPVLQKTRDAWIKNTFAAKEQFEALRATLPTLGTYVEKFDESARLNAKWSDLTNQSTYQTYRWRVGLDAVHPVIRMLNEQTQTFAGNLKKVENAEQDFADLTGLMWEKFKKEQEDHIQGIQDVGKAIVQLGQTFDGQMGIILGGIGTMIDAWGDAKKQIDEAGVSSVTSMQKLQAVIGGAAAVWGATGGTNKTQNIAGGAMAGAATGMSIAMMSGLGVATGGVAIAVGALAGAITGWIRSAKQAEAAQRGFDTELRKMGEDVDKTYGSFDNAVKIAQKFGLALAGATGSSGNRSAEDIGRVKDQLNDLAETLREVDQAASDLGLTWADMDLADATDAATKSADALLKKMDLLKRAGYDVDAIQRQMSPAINEWLKSALQAGVKIPAAMAPIIEKLIRSKQLTEENARLLLGMGEDARPTYAELTEAAGRYGLKLDELGNGVKQIRMTETADQIVKDYDTMRRAGVSFNDMMKNTTIVNDDGTESIIGMQKSLQDLVTESLTTGIKLPANLQPILQKMIDAGLLVDGRDGLGTKLTSLGDLEFETPLVDRIDDLITKIGELIDSLTGPDGFARHAEKAFMDAKQAAREYRDSLNFNPYPMPPSPPDRGSPGEDPRNPRTDSTPVSIVIDGEVVAKTVIRNLANVGGL